jgi:hypothetical protein
MTKIGSNEHTKMKYCYIPRSVERGLSLKKGDEIEFIETEDLSQDPSKMAYLMRKKVL